MINPNTIPNVVPGQLLSTLTTDDDLSVRYHYIGEPIHYGILNRPLTDLEYRNLILARSIDQLQAAYGSTVNYPFLNTPYITNGVSNIKIPTGLLWDVALSIPESWSNVRLFGVQRISGENAGTGEYTGTIRLLLSAAPVGTDTEHIIRSYDLDLETILSYTITSGEEVTASNAGTVLPALDRSKFFGYVVLTSPDYTSQEWIDFLEFVMPPNDTTTNSSGEYVNPALYEVVDSEAGSTNGTNDFDDDVISHGTGILAQSTISYIPGRTILSEAVFAAVNYPFGLNASRTNVDNVEIPLGIFSELSIIAPDNDGGSTDYPVWVSRIRKLATNSIEMIFSTYPIVGTNQPPVEFSKITLDSTMTTDTMVKMVPTNNLYGTTDENFNQNFGLGHVILGDMWSSGDNRKTSFFNKTNALTGTDPITNFTMPQTRLSAFAVSRTPSYTPTLGQAGAMRGSSARKQAPQHPSINNRYVTENDYGIRSQIDLNAVPNIPTHVAIERYGYIGGSAPRTFSLCIDRSLVSDDFEDYYTVHILPRMRAILGSDPEFGDVWYDGTRFWRFNGQTWLT